jgi:hypothetical protein
LARKAEAGRERCGVAVDENGSFVAGRRFCSSSRRFRRKRNDGGDGRF